MALMQIDHIHLINLMAMTHASLKRTPVFTEEQTKTFQECVDALNAGYDVLAVDTKDRLLPELKKLVVGVAPEGVSPTCPITSLLFFSMETLDGKSVPTYGGPCDSFTIPFLNKEEGLYRWYHYDHDAGDWADSTELVPDALIKS